MLELVIISGNNNDGSNNESDIVNDTVNDDNSANKDISSSDSKSNSDSKSVLTYSDAQNMYPTLTYAVVDNAFNEADKDGNGVLEGSEVSEFKRLANLAKRTASNKDSTNYDEKGSITRYCTTHGRVATGSDLKCPYCEAEGLDSRTVKGSTEYY